jgi:4-amino-4-deoxy-L-arabinose transferase-like glycosyltransferase
MLLSGQYLVPHLNGEIYSEKPPLHFWLISLTARLRGELDETAVRWPSAFAAIGAILLVYTLGQRLFNRRVAWVAAAAFGTCLKISWQARVGQIDMVLTFLVTLAMYFWCRAFLDNRPRLYLAFFATSGLATLTKGPAGFLPPLLSVIVFLLVTGRRDELRRMNIGWGLLIWLGIVGAWLIPAALTAGTAYFADIVYMQNLQRYLTADLPQRRSGHLRPWYYYLQTVPADYFPWSLLFPSAAWIAWHRLRDEAKQKLLFPVCWVLVTLVFFSLSPGKRSLYVLTMFPGLALITAAGLDRAQTAWRRYRLAITIPAALAALLLAGVALAVPLLRYRPELSLLTPSLGWGIGAVIALGALGAAAAGWEAWRGRVMAAVTSLTIGMALLMSATTLFVLPGLDVFKSGRPLAKELVRRLESGQAYAMFPRLEPAILYYSRRLTVLTKTEKDLLAFLDRQPHPLVVVRRRDFQNLSRQLPLVEIYRDRALRDGWALMGPGETSR